MLDPGQPGTHRHGDLEHPSDHAHPHTHSGPGERPVVGIVGAGAGRDRARHRARSGGLAGGRGRVAGSRAAGAVPRARDRRPRVRRGQRPRGRRRARDPRGPRRRDRRGRGRSLRLYAGQAMIHTSGLLGAEALRPAMAAGTQAGAFHPLVAFADLDRALAALPGATIAIEGDEELAAHLAEMAEAIGAVPVRLPPGSKAAYHAAAVLAAGGVDRAARHDPRDRRAVRASTRRVRSGSTCRCWSRRSRTRSALGIGAAAHRPGRPRRRGHDRRRTSTRSAPGAPGCAGGLPRAARARLGHRRRAVAPCHRKRPSGCGAALAAPSVTR